MSSPTPSESPIDPRLTRQGFLLQMSLTDLHRFAQAQGYVIPNLARLSKVDLIAAILATDTTDQDWTRGQPDPEAPHA